VGGRTRYSYGNAAEADAEAHLPADARWARLHGNAAEGWTGGLCAMPRWVVVGIGSTPPDDKPYLISSRDDLAQDEQNRDKWKAKWSRTYPGRDSTFKAKVDWAHGIKEQPFEDYELRWDHTYPHEEESVLTQVFMESCPDQVTVQLVVEKSRLNSLQFDDAAAFLGAGRAGSSSAETNADGAASHAISPGAGASLSGALAKVKQELHTDTAGQGSEAEEFEVDQVLDMRIWTPDGAHLKSDSAPIFGHKFEFFVKWKGFYEADNTWEPESNLNCEELIQAFIARPARLWKQSAKQVKTLKKEYESAQRSMQLLENIRKKDPVLAAAMLAGHGLVSPAVSPDGPPDEATDEAASSPVVFTRSTLSSAVEADLGKVRTNAEADAKKFLSELEKQAKTHCGTNVLGRSGGGDVQLICIASARVHKSTTVEDIVVALDSLGLGSSVRGVQLPDHYVNDRFRSLSCPDLVGELPCFPSGDDQHVDTESCVALELALKHASTSSGSSAAEDVDPFMEKVKQTAASEAVKGKKHYLIVGSGDGDSSDDESGSSSATAAAAAKKDTREVLWLPIFFKEEMGRVRRHLHGEGESEEIKKRLAKGNTDTGNLKISIFEREFRAIKDRERVHVSPGEMWESAPPFTLQQNLCAMLALVLAMAQDTYWINDNEFPEEIEKIIKAMGTKHAFFAPFYAKNDPFTKTGSGQT
jgi:hypothetical protein